MPAGAEFAEVLEEDFALWEKTCDYIDEKQFEDARFEAVSKFYEGQISWLAAEALARLWAKAIKENEWHDEDARLIAVKLDLEVKDALAVLGDRKAFKNETAKNEFWR